MLNSGSQHVPNPVTVVKHKTTYGFTLVELSIVLVIIGLIVGGVLVGQDLIKAATIRSQIAQIEKYSTAVNTFRIKYNGIPGDLNPSAATSFGFFTTGMDGTQGLRDGNGVVESLWDYSNWGMVRVGPPGEPHVFWRDLSDASLIDGKYGATLASTGVIDTGIITDGAGTAPWFPAAKLGNDHYIWAYGNGVKNYFQIVTFTTPYAISNGVGFNTKGGITPRDAYAIDIKLDDGLPLTGKVLADGFRPSVLSVAGDGCTLAGTPVTYVMDATNGNTPACAPRIQMQ